MRDRISVPMLLAALALALPLPGAAAEPAQDAPAPSVARDEWPRTQETKEGKLTVYEPQFDEWDGYKLSAHAASSILAPGSEQPMFGVLQIAASTQVNRQARTVALEGTKVVKVTFPAAPAKSGEYQALFQQFVPGALSSISLDRLEASLAIADAERKGRAQPVRNDPPRIVFTRTAAVLVLVDGEASWRQVKDTSLQRVLNTRALLLRDPAGKLYVHVLDGWLSAPALAGPWSLPAEVPPEADKVAKELSDTGLVDLMTGPPDERDPRRRPSLKSGVPQVFVADRPTEVIVTSGEPNWVPLRGTQLLYVNNTTGNVFRNLGDQKVYVLLSGRWFRSTSLEGPWEFVPGKDLPADFSRIPDASLKENVKASVPGTPQANEALIANEIPQTAKVDRRAATFAPRIEGEPVLKPVEGTMLSYVANSPVPIVQVSPSQWYAVEDGIWFFAPSLQGPWSVATSVPPAIYSIPPSSPIYYATFVKVYDVQQDHVVVGYTPGYLGTVVAPGPVVVYGTGYAYPPYVDPYVWVGAAITYGLAVGLAWTPWTGWGYGWGFGWGWGAVPVGWGGCWGWGPAPWWGPYPRYYWGYPYGAYPGRTMPAPPRTAAAWGPAHWSATTANVYRGGGTAVTVRPSEAHSTWTGRGWSSQVAHSYNSRTGAMAAGQKGAVQNVYRGGVTAATPSARGAPAGAAAGRGPAAAPGAGASSQNRYYGSRDGTVYRYDSRSKGFQQQRTDGTWGPVQDPQRAQRLQQQQQARQLGEQRSWGARSAPPGGSYGGFSAPHHQGAPSAAPRAPSAAPPSAPRGGSSGGAPRGGSSGGGSHGGGARR